MKKVDLPGDAVAYLLDRKEMPYGRRRALVAAYDARAAAKADGRGELGADIAVAETVVRVAVGRWTVCAPGSTDVLPVPWDDPTALEQAPGDVVDALLELAGSLVSDLMPMGKRKGEADPKGTLSVTPSLSVATPASTTSP